MKATLLWVAKNAHVWGVHCPNPASPAGLVKTELIIQIIVVQLRLCRHEILKNLTLKKNRGFKLLYLSKFETAIFCRYVKKNRLKKNKKLR